MSSNTPLTFYDTAKDFQPLVAALVALAAAVTAYLSAQASARKQSKTALEVQKRQFQDKRVDEEQTHYRRELAVMIRLGMKFHLMNVLLTDRVNWIKHVKDKCSPVQDEGNVYLIPNGFEIWQWFKNARSVVKEAEIYDSKEEDIQYLDPKFQVVYHSLYRLVSSYDKLHDAVALAEARSPKAVDIDDTQKAATGALDFIDDNSVKIDNRVRELSDKLNIAGNVPVM